MKHSDDQINERLRNALADRFKSIHDQPDPELAKMVLGSIRSRNRFARPAGFVVMALLMIFISIAVDDQKIPTRFYAGIGKMDEMKTDKISTHSKFHTKKRPIHVSIKTSSYLNSEQTKRDTDLPEMEISQLYSPETSHSFPKNNTQTIAKFELLDPISFRSNTAIKMPEIEKVLRKSREGSSKNHWNAMIDFTPMNTSQVIRIGSQQQATYQNFSFPANFTRKKIAFKLKAGIETRGFQFLLHYSQVKQMFDYELATKEFVLDNQGNPMRKGLPRQWHATLHFAGAGLRKSFKLNHVGLKDYHIHTGLDFSKELSSKEHAVWATAGFGRQIQLDKNTSIMAGPYLEYALNKLAAGDAGFKVQPYQIGLSIQLKYKIIH